MIFIAFYDKLIANMKDIYLYYLRVLPADISRLCMVHFSSVSQLMENSDYRKSLSGHFMKIGVS
jgi:hypothetical protein